MTNVFPEHMDTPVARLLPEDILRHQCVPPLLLAYNKFWGEQIELTSLGRQMASIGNRIITGSVFSFNSLNMPLTMPICCTNIVALLITFVSRTRWVLGYSWCMCC